ncbi:MAG: response regulator [Leptospira sp.]|nr:response regulator [Leptospira sp.]
MSNFQSILIVEDDLVFCKILTKFLEKNGYHSSDAQSANQALEILQNTEVDLIVLDYRLPDINGIELIPKIQEISPDTNIILMSRYDDDGLSEKGKSLGAIGFLKKPFDPDELLQMMQR